MTSTTEDLWTKPSKFNTSQSVTLRATGGQRLILRAIQRLLGASFSIAALFLWLLPVGNGGTAEILCKLMVTLVLGFSGAALWQAGTPTPAPELEIDLVRREVRLVRWYGETKSLITRRRFSDLRGAKFDGRDVQLWDQNGELLADLTLPDLEAAKSLRTGLEQSNVQMPVAA
ncbi:MAG: hypothetical protein ABJL99_06970 [Aliishimia sp.]